MFPAWSHACSGTEVVCHTVQEWMTPQPSRRPDPMPEFEKLETPLPKKLPGDPEIPDEEEEEEEEKKKKDPEKDDPDKEKPDAPPGEE